MWLVPPVTSISSVFIWTALALYALRYRRLPKATTKRDKSQLRALYQWWLERYNKAQLSTFWSMVPELVTKEDEPKPSAYSSVWYDRDRSNTVQWYTFWSVILFGLLSIILSFAQCLIGIWQLYYAYHNSQPHG